jgi:uncharacterized protein YdaU (DUF1376 family)
MHYYKFNIADYRKDTSHLSTLEHGVYRQLIDWQYLDEKPIPLETQVVSRRLRLGSVDEQQALENVLLEFFEKSDDGYFQKRIRVEILDYQENSEKNRRNGKLGGRPSKTHSVSSGLPNETQSKGNHKPLTINQEPRTNNHKPIKDKEAIASLSGSTFPPCPHQELLKLWAKHLPHLTQPRSWEGQRQTSMRQRWVQAGKPSSYSPDGYNTVDKGIEWWDSFFRYIAHETKLSTGFVMNDRTWLPDLEWVVNAANFQKIIDGKYNK